MKIPLDTADLFRNYVSVWECLPTPYFDDTAPEYVDWGGHHPFNVSSFVCTDCEHAPFPTVLNPANTSMQDIKDSGNGFPGWHHSNNAKNWSEVFQTRYMNHVTNTPISGVDTWLIAGDGISTLRGVNRYNKEYTILDPMVLPGWVEEATTQDVAFGPGDGQVGIWSATTTKVAPENLHVYYAPGVSHEGLLTSPEIGNFVGDIIRRRSLSPYSEVVYPESQSGTSEIPWVIKWETDAAVWVDNKGEKSVYAGMPVSLDLIDRTNEKLLIGLSHVQPPADDDYVGPLSVTTVYDTRFSYMELGGDVYIYSNSMDYMNLRLIIRPHPQIFDTVEASPPTSFKEKNIDFDTVLGHLKIFESGNTNYNWVFPRSGESKDFIKFSDIGNKGFGAYVDFSIEYGDIPPYTLTLYVDGDGDGALDVGGEICGIKDELSPPQITLDQITANPNPFNASTNLAWELKEGDATELEIHDLSGKLVRVLKLHGGNQGVVLFDGRDSLGKSLASGVYLVTVRDDFNLSRALSKITIVK